MKPMFALGVRASWARLAVAFLAAVVVLVVVSSTLAGPAAVWVSIGLAAVVVAALLVTWRHEHVLTLVWRVARRRPATGLLDVAEAANHTTQWPPTSAAVRAHGEELIAVVAVDGRSHTPSVLDHNRVQSPASLPISVVADALRQFDVTLSGIDVLSLGRRRAPNQHHPYAATYSRKVGDHGAMGSRRTVCVLRMNSHDNVDAVRCRESVAATLTACAQRLAAELTAQHCPARVVDADELDDIDAALGAGVGQPSRAGWTGLHHDGGSVTAYWVSPQDISTETLDRVWVPDCDYTATALQLRPGPDQSTEVGLLVRYATGGPLREPPILGLNPLSGRHDLGVRASLVDAPTPRLRVPHRRLRDDEDLRAPIGSTGVIIGSTMSGHLLLVSLANAVPASTASVTVAGEVAQLLQLAMSHAAIGYQVLVRSSRPDVWRDATGAGLHIVPGLPPKLPNNGDGVMVVYDDPRSSAGSSAARAAAGPRAAITVRLVPARTASVADVHLEQDSENTCVIRTAEFTHRLNSDLSTERNLIRTQKRGRVA